MITVFVTVLDQAALLPKFLDYYTRLGADGFIIIVSGGRANPAWAEALNVCCDSAAIVEGTMAEPTGEAENDALNGIRARFNDGWHVVCDLDEFHDFGMGLQQMAALLERRGLDATRHRLADRHAADLSFPPIQGTLDATYPMQSNLTEVIGGETHKAGMVRHNIPTSVGHHSAKANALDGFLTHHFKWTAGIVERIRGRIALFDRLGVGYVCESKAFLNCLKDGVVDRDTPRLKVGYAREIGI
jgi:hypothetical protein